MKMEPKWRPWEAQKRPKLGAKRESKIDPKMKPGETPNTVKKASFWNHLGVILEVSWSDLGGEVDAMLEASWR